ncbi:hypothetical protein L917_16237 [Phytophthora nicotianae]|uniref:Uncharacterized protein n=1 Tax=Phytophthora nicotianae TaxID=4792 RepID=W2KFM8_PHYNI|nr:hypothetical protein L917_16237 [Phytophthora nicotianae]
MDSWHGDDDDQRDDSGEAQTSLAGWNETTLTLLSPERR